MRFALVLGLLCLSVSGCVSPDQMRQENFVETRSGESIYRYWTFRNQDVQGRSQQLCPNGWREVAPREVSGRMTIYNQGIPIGHDKIWVTIACPMDQP